MKKNCHRYLHNNIINSGQDSIILYVEELNDKQNVSWIADNEINYKGHLFDVLKMINKGDRIILIGSYDSYEDKLVKLLYRLLNDAGQELRFDSLWLWDAIIPGRACAINSITVSIPAIMCWHKDGYFFQYYLSIFRPPNHNTVSI